MLVKENGEKNLLSDVHIQGMVFALKSYPVQQHEIIIIREPSRNICPLSRYELQK